jgi:Right handed beta helix region
MKRKPDSGLPPNDLSRREFLRAAAVTGVLGAYSWKTWAARRRESWSDWASRVVIGAPRDGRDVTDLIQAQIDSVPDYSTIFFRPGSYRCEGSLRVQGRRGLRFRGPATFYATQNGALDLQGMSQRRHWWFIGCRDIRVDRLRVVSTNTVPDQLPGFGAYQARYEFEHGFAIHHSENVVVTNCSTFGTWGDGLYIGNERPSRNVLVDNLVVEYNGRQGVALSNAAGVLLSNIKIKNTRRSGFDLEPATNGWFVRNVEISDSFVNGYHVAFAAGGVGDVSNVFIHNNVIKGPGVPWVFVEASDGYDRQNWRVQDNRVQDGLGSPMPALYFAHLKDVSILRNVSPISSTQSRLAIRFDDAQGQLNVHFNDFRQATRLYELLNGSSPVIASGNLLS